MTPTEHLEVIRREGATLLAVASRDLSAPIPRYPGWSALDLLVHTGSVHRRTTRVVRELRREVTEREYPPEESPEVVLPWFSEGLEEMLQVLAAADPTASCWGFGPHPSVGGWCRRMALETAIHRWDAEAALASPAPLPADLAADGLEEFGGMQLPKLADVPAPLPDAVIALRPTDHPRCFLVRFTDPGLEMAEGEAPAHAVLSGTASDLYLELMGRGGEVAASGDPQLVAAWRQALAALPDAAR